MLTIPSYYCRTVVKNIHNHGINTTALLAKLGISQAVLQEDNGVIHAEQFVSLVRESWDLLDDEYWGLSGTRCKPGLFALMVRYVQQFDTLEVLIHEICRFYNSCRDDIAFDIIYDDNQVVFSISLAAPEKDSDHFLVEFVLLCMHRFLCWITDKRLFLQHARFAYPEPDHSAYYQSLFPCEKHFNQNKNSFSFDKKFISLAINKSKSDIIQFLKNAPADFMVMPGSDDSFNRRIKSLLIEHQYNGCHFPDFNSIAATLCVSPSTLRRKLQAEKNSYQQIKDIIRRDIAIEKLIYESVSIADIAHQLGFVEPASFTRAFKQWTGVSPAEYRSNATT